jgi:hypothetical protein
MKKLLAALVALSLAACTTFPAVPDFDPAASAPAAGLANKAIPALITAWRAFDAALTAADALATAGVLPPGSARAVQVRDALQRARNALNAATDAVRAGNATSYAEAMGLAQQAFTEANQVIGGH